MTSTAGWASEVSRPPWRTRFDAAEREWAITDGHGALVGYLVNRRDAEFVCACVNGELGNPKAMTVRYVSAGVWLGQCNYCQPTHLVLGQDAFGTLHQLQAHFRQTHDVGPESKEIELP